jgi:hypothetical protein
MSRERWFLSLLIAYHLVAVALAALPTRDALDRFNETRLVRPTFLPTVLDALAAFAHDGELALMSGSSPLRLMTRPYIQAGLRQRWNMFSNPGTDDHYMRVDYYYENPGPAPDVMVARELVFPADDETRVRLMHRFRDKAIFNAVETYFLRRDRREARESSASDAREALVPVSQHFTRQFGRSRLPQGSRMIRTETWYGSAPIPFPGAEVADGDLLMRLTVLDRYRDATLPPQRGALAPPAIGATQREADITWMLVDVEEGR